MRKREPALPASARPPGRPDDPANLRRFAGEFPTGVAVVTALIFLRGQFSAGWSRPRVRPVKSHGRQVI